MKWLVSTAGVEKRVNAPSPDAACERFIKRCNPKRLGRVLQVRKLKWGVPEEPVYTATLPVLRNLGMLDGEGPDV